MPKSYRLELDTYGIIVNPPVLDTHSMSRNWLTVLRPVNNDPERPRVNELVQSLQDAEQDHYDGRHVQMPDVLRFSADVFVGTQYPRQARHWVGVLTAVHNTHLILQPFDDLGSALHYSQGIRKGLGRRDILLERKEYLLRELAEIDDALSKLRTLGTDQS